MYARFDAQCERCDGDIVEGFTEITHVSGLGWVHADPDDCEELRSMWEDDGFEGPE